MTKIFELEYIKFMPKQISRLVIRRIKPKETK